MRLRRLAFLACGLGLLTLSIAGCSETGTEAEENPDSRGRTAALPGDSQTPSPRSGDLGQEDLPKPEELGEKWEYRVDHGNAEDGYVGSGEPAIARDPLSVVAAITPLGCRPQRLPTPSRALEVTYQRGATPGVGMVLAFGSDDSAREFFDTHAATVSDCVEAARVDVEVLQASADAFVSSRTEQLGQTPSWVEAMTLNGDRITLVAVADPSDRGVEAVLNASN